MGRHLAPNEARSLSVSDVVTLGTPSTVSITCIHLGGGNQVWASGVNLTAIRVTEAVTQ